jgi:tetratricopeptide (TPR) repeat protein
MRNAGAILAETDAAAALPLFQKAAELLPDDQQTLLGYGTCLLRLGRKDEADPLLTKCVKLNPLTETAEHARTARTKLAHETMRGNVAGGLRPDVVMYCLGALQKFQALGSDRLEQSLSKSRCSAATVSTSTPCSKIHPQKPPR